MKYNIMVNQRAFVEEGSELDIVDAAILEYIYFLCSTVNEKVEKERHTDSEGRRWTWVDYQRLMFDLPLIRINTASSITLRIKKILTEGWILAKRVGNQRLYVRLNEKIDKLFVLTNSSIRPDEQLNSKSYSFKRTYNSTSNNTTKTQGNFKKTVDNPLPKPIVKTNEDIKKNKAELAKIRRQFDWISPVPKGTKGKITVPHYED